MSKANKIIKIIKCFILSLSHFKKILAVKSHIISLYHYICIVEASEFNKKNKNSKNQIWEEWSMVLGDINEDGKINQVLEYCVMC